MSMGNFPEILSQQNLSRDNFSREIWRKPRLALIILTLSFITFGLIDVMSNSYNATMAGLLCAVGSGTMSYYMMLYYIKSILII